MTKAKEDIVIPESGLLNVEQAAVFIGVGPTKFDKIRFGDDRFKRLVKQPIRNYYSRAGLKAYMGDV